MRADGSPRTLKLRLHYDQKYNWWIVSSVDSHLISYCLDTLEESANSGRGIALWADEAVWKHNEISRTVTAAKQLLDNHTPATEQ